MRELSVAEQRYEAVLADGETVTDVAARFGVSRGSFRRKSVSSGPLAQLAELRTFNP